MTDAGISRRPSINCDCGESWEAFRAGWQAEWLQYADLANVCCGEHAGDADLTRATFFQVAQYSRRAGAHPGYPDREHFGRRPLFGTTFRAADIEDLVARQVAFAQTAAREAGLELYHVKPHGALYNEASAPTDEAGEIAEAIAKGVLLVARDVFLVGLAGSQMLNVFRRQGFAILREAFADRRYGANGLLVPRSEANAILNEADEVRRQVRTWQDRADTFCVHGEGHEAGRRLRQLSVLIPALPPALPDQTSGRKPSRSGTP
ncbi:MAG: LamB/YcsF family protein [Bryobacter sp.]|nr:LamB/YcsF family protein [Bryobacter sp.]